MLTIKKENSKRRIDISHAAKRKFNSMPPHIRMWEMAKVAEQYLNEHIKPYLVFSLGLGIVNMEELYQKDMETGKGFILDETFDYSNLDNDTALIDNDTIFSFKFSFRSNDTPYAHSKRFRCECGHIEGEVAGIKCPCCGSYTKDRPITRGWFVLKNYKIPNPYWFDLFIKYLKKGIDKSRFRDELFTFTPSHLIERYKRENKKFRICKYTILDIQDPAKLEDLIREYINPDDQEYFLARLSSALTSKIPVINRDYRAYAVQKKIGNKSDVTSHPTNKLYIQISGAVNAINSFSKNKSPISVLGHLNTLTNLFKDVKDELVNSMAHSKKADIRDRIASRRKDYGGRYVLEGLQYPDQDVCTLPYAYFGELTIDQHRDIYKKYGLTADGEFRMKSNTPNVSDKIIMNKVLQELTYHGLNICIVSRSPNIYKESMIAVRIIGLDNSNVIRLSEIAIAECLAGDKDGDIILAMITCSAIRRQTAIALSPKKMIYNPITGGINGSCELPESVYFIAHAVLEVNEHESDSEKAINLKEVLKDGYEKDPYLEYN